MFGPDEEDQNPPPNYDHEEPDDTGDYEQRGGRPDGYETKRR
jgi:hypothetical protein